MMRLSARTKNTFTAFGLLAVLFVVIEGVQLLRIGASIPIYDQYWQTQRAEQGELLYVALGDSAAQGIGASSPELGYVGRIERSIEQSTGKSVRVINLSVSGAVINDVTDKQLPQLRGLNPDYVTVEIGANDVVRYDSRAFEEDFRRLAPSLPAKTIVANMPYFGGIIQRDSQVADANRIIQKVVGETPGLRLADLYTTTYSNNGVRNYAADLFHPSDRGYKNWADTFLRQLNP